MWQNATNVIFAFMDMKEVIENGENHFLPNLSVDLVIIGYEDNQLKCLLLKMGHKWMLPGGYVKLEESVDHAASRVLQERAGLDHSLLKFLAVFGDSNRKFNEEFRFFFEKNDLKWREDLWVNNRFVTMAFYSLVDINNTHPVAGLFAEEVGWFSIDDLPDLWLDHTDIIYTARKKLKSDIKAEPITHNLLPSHFTMPQLHQLHEVILEDKLDRSRFQKNMLATGLFERLPQVKKDSPGRNPFQYRIK
jgi:ADP-ribose pyrophosphatase YjhB (NUDIX family)